MRSSSIAVVLCACVAMMLCNPILTGAAENPSLRPLQDWSHDQFGKGRLAMEPYYESAAVDTYCLMWYTFDQIDSLEQGGITTGPYWNAGGPYWHADDFVGVDGRQPIMGSKSMWCGARKEDPRTRNWSHAPGYGNCWDQTLTSTPIPARGKITWSFLLRIECEKEFDFVKIEYDKGNKNWVELAKWTGGPKIADSTVQIPLLTANTKLRFHFISNRSNSDEDSFSKWATKLYGACVVDNVNVQDNGTFSNFQDFESADRKAKIIGPGVGSPLSWVVGTIDTPGAHAGLENNLQDKDPCGDNFSKQVVFFIGSPYPSSSYPGLYDTPFCTGDGGITAPCQDEIIISPVIDMTKYSTVPNSVQNATIPTGDLPLLGGAHLRFAVYRDLPLSNLVFYQWHVRKVVDGYPGPWMDEDLLYYGPDQDYFFATEDVSRFIGGNAPVQIALGVVDMCNEWYLVYGNCAAHTPSPWFDNLRLYRFKTAGPQWGYRDIDLFQDNFPTEETPPWGCVRADAANDLKANDIAGIDPGDSIVVECASPLGGGIDTMPNGSPAVYMHVKTYWIGAGAPPATSPCGQNLGAVVHGIQLQGTYGLWLSTDAGGWDVLRMDIVDKGPGIAAGKFMIDLNDSLFVPGYETDYYFTATDIAGVETALPRWARSCGPYFEWTCLPTGNSTDLFVDDFTSRGSWNGSVEDYWNQVFKAVLPANAQPDRYDVNAPSSGVSNGLGSRANAGLLCYQYYKIIWDSGDLAFITLSDGTTNSDKSNDCQVLIDWMSLAEHVCGLWVCGDNIAYDLNKLASTPALTLMSTWCGVDYIATSYFDETGGRTGGGTVTPLVTGDADAGIFVHLGVPDKWFAYGGCFVINQFDVLDKTANGKYAAFYPVKLAVNRYAAIASTTLNPSGFNVNAMWFGFSYQYVRDDVIQTPEDRFEIARDVFSWMQNCTNEDITLAETPKFTKLAQNFPNPFNPSTTIKFELKEKGLVTLKVYSVAGQLVRTLVDGMRDASSYTVAWDGRNNIGSEVASGIYFYKMETKGFSATKKLVLLR
jgi:hypothetical protein